MLFSCPYSMYLSIAHSQLINLDVTRSEVYFVFVDIAFTLHIILKYE